MNDSTHRPFLGTVHGLSMWPALRPGDRLFGRRYEPALGRLLLPGNVLVASVEGELIAHRLVHLSAGRRDRWAELAGDLSGSDGWVSEEALRSVAETLHRPGLGFRDIPPVQPLGPVGRGWVRRLAGVSDWAAKRAGRRSHPSEEQTPLLL